MCSIAGTALAQPALDRADLIASVSANANAVSVGALLSFIAAATSAGVAIAMYPVVTRGNAALALTSVVFRSIEAVMYTIGAVSLLTVLAVNQQLAGDAAADRGSFRSIADALLALRE